MCCGPALSVVERPLASESALRLIGLWLRAWWAKQS